MTDNTKMVDLPWHDGTTRTVPEWTAYKAANGHLHFALDDGYSNILSPEEPFGNRHYHHYENSAAVCIFTEAPEPPVKVNVPTGLGAIVSNRWHRDEPAYVLTRKGWRGLSAGDLYEASEIVDALRNGARILYEGVEEGGN